MPAIDEERKALGLPVRATDPMANVTGDNELFKYELITPHEPMGVATYHRDRIDGDGKISQEEFKQAVPKLVSTMALGNLNSKEVALARIYAELARITARHGYNIIAYNFYLKWVHLNVTSQSHQAQLLSQVLSETVRVTRKEEAFSGTRDFNQEKPSKIQEMMDKWKGSGVTMGGNQQQQNNQSFGLKP